jgi:hypothetical protein
MSSTPRVPDHYIFDYIFDPQNGCYVQRSNRPDLVTKELLNDRYTLHENGDYYYTPKASSIPASADEISRIDRAVAAANHIFEEGRKGRTPNGYIYDHGTVFVRSNHSGQFVKTTFADLVVQQAEAEQAEKAAVPKQTWANFDPSKQVFEDIFPKEITADYFRLKKETAAEFAKRVCAELEKNCGNAKVSISSAEYQEFGQQIAMTLTDRGFYVWFDNKMILNISTDKIQPA